MLKILTWLLDISTKNRVVFSQFGAGLAAAVVVLNYFNDLWTTLFARVDALVVNMTAGTLDFSPCGLVNYIFPLDDVCTAITAYAALRLACAGIRVLKSFIPTISG